MSVYWYQVYQARLQERLLTSQGFPSDSTCVLEAEPGKLYIIRCETGNISIYLFTHWFTLQTGDFYLIIDFCSIQRHRRHSKSARSRCPVKDNSSEIKIYFILTGSSEINAYQKTNKSDINH